MTTAFPETTRDFQWYIQNEGRVDYPSPFYETDCEPLDSPSDNAVFAAPFWESETIIYNSMLREICEILRAILIARFIALQPYRSCKVRVRMSHFEKKEMAEKIEKAIADWDITSSEVSPSQISLLRQTIEYLKQPHTTVTK
jgi:hypothetical protein